MARRVAIHSERIFAALCSNYGAVCHKSEEDENGWDYYVEFADDDHLGPADEQPPAKRAFAQVKSTVGKRATTLVKLSNLRKAAQDPTPWFVALFLYDGPGEPTLYLKHFWKDLIEDTLKAVRQADIEGVKLNRRRRSISFDETDRVDGDFVAWMRAQIAAQTDYTAEKARMYRELGFERGRGEGQIRVSADSQDAIFKEFLGLGQGLKVESFTYTPKRFQIADTRRTMTFETGTVHFTPQPMGKCEVILRPGDKVKMEPPIKVPGELYAVPIIKNCPVRVSAPPLELLIRPGSIHLDMTIHMGQQTPLQTWRRYAGLKKWSLKGPLEVEIWKDGKMGDASILIDDEQPNSSGYRWDQISQIAEAVAACAPADRWDEIMFSIADMNHTAPELGYFYQGRAPLLQFVCEAEADMPADITSLVYYTRADLAGWTFGYVAKRRVMSDVVEGDQRFVTSGAPELLETYAFMRATEEERASIPTHYDRIIDALTDRENPLGFGDLQAFVTSQNPVVQGRPRIAD